MSQELLEVLKEIKHRPVRLDQGICGNLRTTVGDEKWKVMSLHLRAMMDKWPERLPNRFYPVEGTQERYMADAANRILWQNPRRIALLDWLIEELEGNG